MMGVSGCGKSTIGREISASIPHSVFLDGDDFHQPANIDKMQRGVPLNDDDRMPWLNKICDEVIDRLLRLDSVVVACSCLKKKYRDVLRRRIKNGNALNESISVRFVHLVLSKDVAMQRVEKREGHFMKAQMVTSQFEALEHPDMEIEPDCVNVEATLSMHEIVEKATQK